MRELIEKKQGGDTIAHLKGVRAKLLDARKQVDLISEMDLAPGVKIKVLGHLEGAEKRTSWALNLLKGYLGGK